MKIGVLSDLHLLSSAKLPRPAQVGDAMVLAGDIGVGIQGVSWAKSVFDMPVIYIPGNHEYYNRDIDKLDDELRDYTGGSQVHVLQNEQLIVAGVRFIGATLWTDFALFGTTGTSALLAQEYLNDYRVIGKHNRALKPSETMALHQTSRTYLERALAESFDGPTVVVTHHAPSARSVAPRYQGDPLSPCFASNLDDLVARSRVALWIHGHVHDTFDYMVGRTRVVCNPKGYAGEEQERESPPFRWDYGVELPV